MLPDKSDKGNIIAKGRSVSVPIDGVFNFADDLIQVRISGVSGESFPHFLLSKHRTLRVHGFGQTVRVKKQNFICNI